MLRLEKVRVRLQEQLVLRDVCASISDSHTVALIGRNGAGKTTLLRSIMGLLPLENGRILLDDLDLATVPSYGRARLGLGYAPEDRRLIAEMSVEENLLLPSIALRLSTAERKRRLDHVFALLPELATLRRRKAGAVSGGQGKIVALGRALMVGTRYILLDEPFQGLAPALALSYAATLAKLRYTTPGLGLVITESTPQLLDKIVDRWLTIERGELFESSALAATTGVP